MSGSDLQGRWMPSSVTEEDVLKLREAKFLTGEISHRLPAQGQAFPSPQPGESVVFVSHFLWGLGFPMDPFVRGLMFYYGLDFHDLAPESILHISSFIVVCEAFLRITPHFGLWLKTFTVEPKMVEGRHAESVTRKEIYISVLPSLPSAPRRVPSGHGTKSSILYLHSPTVRPKDIVRLSGDPLIQDSLSSP